MALPFLGHMSSSIQESRGDVSWLFWGHICLLPPLSRLGTYSSSLTLALCKGTEYFYLKVGTDIFLAFPVPPKL